MILDQAFAIGLAVMIYVTVERLLELVVARRNTRRLVSEGAYEVGASHYILIIVLHAAWLVSLWLFAPGRPIVGVMLALFGVVQILRFWTLLSIGRRWTTRILIVPGETPVAKGPYRFLSHPYYVVVICEIFLLPAAFGLWEMAILFSMINAAVLMIRIPAETSALRQGRG